LKNPQVQAGPTKHKILLKMKKISTLVLGILLVYGCSKDTSNKQAPMVVAPSVPLSQKAELALMEFELSHGSKRNQFPNFGGINGQTPIDIPNETKKFESKDPVINYEAFSLNNNNVENYKGETLQINATGNNFITIRGKRYDLAQFHFHRDSEHAIKGKKSAMEMHFVHVAQDGKIAVMGVMLQETKRENEKLEILFENAPSNPDQFVSVSAKLNPLDLLPKTAGRYYSYSGSLTTPNLDEVPNPDGLNWIVFASPIHLSTEQLQHYAEIFEEKNARILQPIGGRTIWMNAEYRIR
jgi:carbonic anhydrase